MKKRLVDFFPYLSVVIFEPEDLDLVSGSPSLRRHYIDILLSSLDRDYWRNISYYNKIIIRRNKVLQRVAEGNSKQSELDFWDARLLDHATVISKKRDEAFEFLNFIEKGNSFGNLGGLSWQLKKSEVSADKLLK